MVKLVLHRTHILNYKVKGYLTIEGSKFSCYTLEAESIEGHHPNRPSLNYSLETGIYRCKLGFYSMYPLVPEIMAYGYKKIGFVKQETPFIRPGCVAIGSKFISERFLDGFEDVYNALHDIITSNYKEWKDGFLLEIVNDPTLVNVHDGTYEENLFRDCDEYNFVDL